MEKASMSKQIAGPEVVELEEGGAAFGPQRLRLVQHSCDPSLLCQGVHWNAKTFEHRRKRLS